MNMPMRVITFVCPTTKAMVSTGIETDEVSFAQVTGLGITISCPACGQVHAWEIVNAWLAEKQPLN